MQCQEHQLKNFDRGQSKWLDPGMTKWNFRGRRKLKFVSLSDPPAGKPKPMFKIFTVLKSLKREAERLCFSRKGRIRVSDDPTGSGKSVKPPKGHLIVYVGGSPTETSASLVPVVYFNHPMFIKLLESSEKVNGFNHPGRISIPCEASKFDKVKRIIAASEVFRQHRLALKPWFIGCNLTPQAASQAYSTESN